MPYTVGHFALGLEGLALLRAGPRASDAALGGRVAELMTIGRSLDDPAFESEAIGAQIDVVPGYARWASVYDGPNPEAIRQVAERNGLPVDDIAEVRVLDPYFYTER